MRQILYASWSNTTGDEADVARILEQSRHNNALEGVTGVLWADGKQFVQVLEGPDDSVQATFERIRGDPRHHNIIVLHDMPIAEREFGGWSMVLRRARDPAGPQDLQMRRLLSKASQPVREQFLALIASGDVIGS
jgi:FAD-dependent sensor of blue light